MAMLAGQVINILTFDVADGRIVACYAIRNPDKLRRVDAADPEP